jgi:hypothetical protein
MKAWFNSDLNVPGFENLARFGVATNRNEIQLPHES